MSEARPRPRRVRVRGASVSALDLARPRSSRVRVRWCPRPSRVRVRWRPLLWMSASTGMSVRTSAGRPRPWPSLTRSASLTASLRFDIALIVDIIAKFHTNLVPPYPRIHFMLMLFVLLPHVPQRGRC